MSRKKLYEGIMCNCCKERPAETKGLCKRCYSKLLFRKQVNNLHPGGKRGPDISENTKKALNLLQQGNTQSEVARIMGVSRQRINKIARIHMPNNF